MKVSAINVYQHNNFYKNSTVRNARNEVLTNNQPTLAFKGGKGAALGVFGGFLTGAALTALTIATGGLAGVVAIAGAGATTVAGGAACTHLGGIIGNAIEESGKKED